MIFHVFTCMLTTLKKFNKRGGLGNLKDGMGCLKLGGQAVVIYHLSRALVSQCYCLDFNILTSSIKKKVLSNSVLSFFVISSSF